MYSPKISEELVRLLYQLKIKTGKPITVLANSIIKEYFEKQTKENSNERGS